MAGFSFDTDGHLTPKNQMKTQKLPGGGPGAGASLLAMENNLNPVGTSDPVFVAKEGLEPTTFGL